MSSQLSNTFVMTVVIEEGEVQSDRESRQRPPAYFRMCMMQKKKKTVSVAVMYS